MTPRAPTSEMSAIEYTAVENSQSFTYRMQILS
jgi:hypothetical protein